MVGVDWRGWSGPFKSSPKERRIPAVFAQTWLSDDGGTVGVILVNHTSSEVTAVFPWNAKDWGIKPGSPVAIRRFLDGKWHADAPTALPDKVSVHVPPHTPMLMTIAHRKR